MKKLFLLTLVLLAFAATYASASTINLAWGQCRTGLTVAENDFNWPFQPCTDGQNAFGAPATMIASFKNSSPYANFLAATTEIEVYVGNGSPLADFWVLDSGCHAGGWGGRTVIPPTGLPTGCASPYGGSVGQTDNQGFNYTNAAIGRFHWGCDHARSALIATLNPPGSAGGYISQIIDLVWDDASFDGGTCAGCEIPACIGLQKVSTTDASPTKIEDISTAEIQNYITYAGGATTPGGTCPGAVPTKSSTWGQVKALYR
jgi:hypothetical protein